MTKSILGAHMSISGGLYRAVEAAEAAGCQCVQIFTKNSNQWKGKALTPKDVELFREAQERCGISHPISHDSYLINLGSPSDELWLKSIAAFEDELLRANELGIPFVVTHPGSYTTSTPQEGLDRIAEGLRRVLEHTDGIQTRCLLENTAGQGTNLGFELEHIAQIIESVEGRKPAEASGDDFRLGVCFDTCHAFAAGYDFSTPEKYAEMTSHFDEIVGLVRFRAFHINDAMKDLGSRVDRHAHIGEGKIPLESFRLLLSDPRFEDVPKYLETPKGTKKNEETGLEEDRDVVNLRTLRSLIGE
ncbi:MAG: deoxyribonuclease IV [Thermoguttaceae bacterium]|nr:deoxyribonuclease IV [Thermoguttaceae bacterium]